MFRWKFNLAILCVFLCSCEKTVQETLPSRTLPVKTLVLQEENPARELRVSASAKPWREQTLSFLVGGKVAMVREYGSEVDLLKHENEAAHKIEGEVVASLEYPPYDAKLAAAQALLAASEAEVKVIEAEIKHTIPEDIKVAQEQLESFRLQVEEILPTDLSAAESNLNLARLEQERAQKMYQSSSGTKQAYEQSNARFEAASSVYKKTLAMISSKKREWAGAKASLAKAKAELIRRKAYLQVAHAQVSEAKANLKFAQINRYNCDLRTPFSGVVSRTHLTRGAAADPSVPVLQVTMMDPIFLEVAVSAEVARTLEGGDAVMVYPETSKETFSTWIHIKSSMADAKTRTYRIVCIMRNRLITPRGGIYQRKKNSLHERDITPVFTLDPSDPDSPLMVGVDTIRQDEQGYFAWTVDNFVLGKQSINVLDLDLAKARFTLGTGFKSFVNRDYREIGPCPELQNGMLTIRRKNFPKIDSQMELSYLPTDWMIRPGDLVPISFDLGNYPKGIYIPLEAIQKDTKGYHIFIHKKGHAHRVPITIHETFKNMRRVESSNSLKGAELIVWGSHYVKEGDQVAASPMEVNGR